MIWFYGRGYLRQFLWQLYVLFCGVFVKGVWSFVESLFVACFACSKLEVDCRLDFLGLLVGVRSLRVDTGINSLVFDMYWFVFVQRAEV